MIRSRLAVRRAFASLAAIAAVAAVPFAASAQAPLGGDATVVARAYFDALAAGRWADVPPLIHPVALREFRASRVSSLRSLVDPLGRPAPADTADAAAMVEWRERRRAREAMGSPVAREFAGVETLAELTALSTEEMVVRWLQARDPSHEIMTALAGTRARLEAHLRARGDTAALDSLRAMPDSTFAGPVLRELGARARHVVVGSIADDDSTAHVAYRMVDPTIPAAALGVPRPRLLTLRRTAGVWRLWEGWTDRDAGGGMIAFVQMRTGADSAEIAMLREAAARTVAWPPPDTAGDAPTAPSWPRGRAWLVGEVSDTTPPRALVVEVRARDGAAPVRIEIPPSAFGELLTLLSPWPAVLERAASLRRTPSSTGR